ncbi:MULTISPECIES: MptD family putative ECF transporter S component [Coriobacteriales]|uniref:MptD family putative ECF transporter S component n=1 Tax=Coriobacteriales TaxID=84999 RepID=UPI00039602DD|nr:MULTISPECIES: MptD family putative ECF transporter S component [Coriobacteriales]ERI03984.1 hypothetical protein HMPREF9069_01748 [Atopobium sp. oral taxon 810 str. F0209]ERL12643.1 TIGR02185 family protein [Coriobacteriaceae bacterium BV3Ac1]
MEENNKLAVKDLINIGVFTSLYFMVFFVVSFIGYIPILLVLLPAICPIVAGIPYMLFLTRAKKFGMVTIMALILGLLELVMGRPWPVLFIAIAAGLCADLILKAGQYKSVKSCVLSSGILSLWMIGMALPLFFSYRDNYLAGLVSSYGQAYVDTLASLTPDWALFVLIALCFVGGIIGGLMGSAVLKKHFRKAGMA